ncbi:MAG TPA: hypothetical protein VIM56_01630 [Rhizomicrobium sp.]
MTLRDRFIVAITSLTAFGFLSSAMADSLVPAQQSKCEIAANKFAAQHPHVDPFDYLKAGFFPFGGTPPPNPPTSYRDPESGIVFRVESDARRITAIDKSGGILWVRNPFVDSDMCPYRSAHPFIYWIGAPGGDFGRHYLSVFTPTPDVIANKRIVEELASESQRNQKIKKPPEGAQFIGVSFNSSQVGYMNIANGDFYVGGQD